MAKAGSRWRVAEKVLFAFGCMTIAFLCGMLVARARIFPYPEINAAQEAVKDWRENWRHYLGVRSRFTLPSERTEGGVVVSDPALAFSGYTFVSAYRPSSHEGFNNYLLGMDGKIVHEWNADIRRIWPDLEDEPDFVWDGSLDIHGAHLFDNGDIVVDIGALGTARLDRCSNVRWAIRRPTHHQVEALPDGGILTPSTIHRTRRLPEQIYADVGPSGYFMDDTILRLDADGNPVEEHSVIDMLLQSGWASALIAGPGAGKIFSNDDPLHVNDVERLPEEIAAAFPMFTAGDLLISVRHLNTIFVADSATWRIKWLMTGPFVGQHDPDFLPNGHILVYDNRLSGEQPKLGNSRLVEIDPLTKSVVWTFEGKGESAFYAHSRGEQQMLPNGDILYVDPYRGRVLEVAPKADNRLVWEWVNLIAPHEVGLVTDVERFAPERLPWVGTACPDQIATAWPN
ncbi:MAG: arylsulfotransferase family protein [Geminicoccaceae bacterium]